MPVGRDPWFPSGGEVPAEDLVGREPFIADTVARVGVGESLVVSGPRRTGKTSVVLEVLRRLRSLGWMTAYVDVAKAPTESRLAEEIADAVLGNETGVRRTLARVRTLLTEAAGKLHVETKTPDGFELAVSFASASKPDLEDALELGDALASRTGRKICIVFDEFQDADRVRRDAFAFMRALLQHHRHAVYLFLGSQVGLLERQFLRSNASFFRFAIVRPLPPVAADDWIPYLVARFDVLGHGVEAETAADLVGRTGAHPHCTMVMANKLLLALKADMQPHLALRVAYGATLRDLSTTYESVFREQAVPAGAQEVLLELARGELQPIRAHRKRALRTLVDRAVLRHDGRGRYAFVEPLFAEHLRRAVSAG